MDTVAQHLATATQLHQAGRLDRAEQLYREILSVAPAQPDALHLLGLVAYQTGRHGEAIDLIERALALFGPHPVYSSNLGAVYLEVGRLDDAIAACRASLQLHRGHAQAHNNMGMALLRQGRNDEAATAFGEALRIEPNYVDARCNLGAALHRQGKLEEELRLLEETVRIAPGHAQVQNDLGGALLACNQAELAEPHFREAIRLRPKFAEAYGNLGHALRELDRSDESLECFREAIRLKPEHAAAHSNMGYTLEFLGKIDEARVEFERALQLDPNHARALAGLAGLASHGHHSVGDDVVRRIEALVRRSDLPVDDLSRLHFALARIRDKAGAYDEAFEHYRQGNELRKEYVRCRGSAFDPATQRRQTDRLIAVFSPAYFERVAGYGIDTELPVFVVGMMRSGTTLAEQILASHPQVYGAGELREFALLKTTLQARLGAGEEYPECALRLNADAARALADEHLQGLCQRGGTATRVVDKMPFNFLNLGLVATLFPKARIVHCRRDPVDTCLSSYFQNFGWPHAFTLDLAHLGAYYREYERVMAHWAQVLPMPIFELCYEELIADQEAVSRRLIAFCGLDWDDRCLRFHETERSVRTASVLQVRKPMYRGAVGRWKRYERHLQPLVEALELVRR